MKAPFLRSVHVRNFKAIRDSGAVRLTPLTVFIGNNGSGKSGLIEALETLQTLVMYGVDAAMQMWRGIEHVRNKTAVVRAVRSTAGIERSSKPISFKIRGRDFRESFAAEVVLNERHNTNELFLERQSVRLGRHRSERRDQGAVITQADSRSSPRFPAGGSWMDGPVGHYVCSWQFANLWPARMGDPLPQTRMRGGIRLAKDGANIAEFLLDLRTRDLAAFEGLVEALRHVLPYAKDVQPAATTELERTVYLQLSEAEFKVPGWLLSTGTLRLLALLALLRHPEPPPVIFIEEIENSLDPRTIHLLVDEIHRVVESGVSQVIVATHSPYLLDLLPLETIVLVERIDDEPVFSRPADDAALRKWAKEFSPGQLYTMNRMGRR